MKENTNRVCPICLEEHPAKINCVDSTKPCVNCGRELKRMERWGMVEKINGGKVIIKPLCKKCMLSRKNRGKNESS